MSSLSDAINSIRSEYTDDAYVRRVKELVAARLQSMDATAKIENTQYFNHTAIPDFVISWPGDRLTRDIYLRGSYASIIAGQDVSNLVERDPIFLALSDQQTFTDEPEQPILPETVRAESGLKDHTLLTDVSAVGSLGDAAPTASGPLTSLVQANFVRGARGLVDDERAEQLVSTETVDNKTTLSSVLRETFTNETFARMERGAAIVDLAMTPPGADDRGALEQTAKLTGQLSDAEMLSVIPWVVRNTAIRQPASFWRRLGGLFPFEALERIAELIDGIDISDLVRANSQRWLVRRSYVGVTDYSNVDRTTRKWSFSQGRLTVDSDYQRIVFSSTPGGIRGRTNSVLPRWNEVSAPLDDFRLRSVDIRGESRSVKVDAEKSQDIRQDVVRVTESIEDNYRVAALTVRFVSDASRSGVSDAEVDLSRAITTAPVGITIDEMLRASLRLVAHRNAPSMEEIDRISLTEAAGPASDA